MTFTAEIGPGQLAELVKEMQAGHEVVLTQGNQPIAKLVPTGAQGSSAIPFSPIRSFSGHQVLTPHISQGEIAEEMFGRQ